jgi:hypothetical protein
MDAEGLQIAASHPWQLALKKSCESRATLQFCYPAPAGGFSAAGAGSD